MNRESLPAEQDEIFDLVVRYLDGELAPDELERLGHFLSADPHNRQTFVDVCLQAKLFAEKLGNRLQDATAATVPATGEIPIELPERGRSPVLGFLSDALAHVPGGEFIVGTLVVSAVLAAGWGLTRLREHLAARNANATAAGAGDTDYLATLTACEGCRWIAHDLPTVRAARLTAGELEVESGVAEITFDSGARIVFEGPARLRLETARRAHLQYGRAVAYVPRAAIGFTLASPSVTVVDLGTEFGLDVDAAGAAELHVFDGRVEAHSTQGKTNAAPMILGVAASARFDRAGGAKKGNVEPAQFVRHIEQRRVERARLAMVEEGGTLGPGNLARAPGARAFARNVLPGHPQHRVEFLNDGRYGNDHSWISEEAGPSLAGIDLGRPCRVDAIAFGRDNGPPGQYRDRWQGTYTIQYTTVAHPDEHTADADWRTIDVVKYDPSMPQIVSEHIHPHLRHRFRFTPVLASGVRILTSNGGTGIDELEIYGSPVSD